MFAIFLCSRDFDRPTDYPGVSHACPSIWRRRVWLPACATADLRGTGFHDLRRASATAPVAGGVNVKTAQDRLGHSDPRLTLDLYAQVTTAADREAADVVGEHFLPSFAHAARTRAVSPQA